MYAVWDEGIRADTSEVSKIHQTDAVQVSDAVVESSRPVNLRLFCNYSFVVGHYVRHSSICTAGPLSFLNARIGHDTFSSYSGVYSSKEGGLR